ncbi:cupin domain-containing protein [Acuticoccus sp. M5D2P5]|uniref:cupin domain-containing protein n=1 Tax=Acuticoccus kalidii TaxID=2910977 RepID=UPI001F48596E|nr:cupin domain-containing protein [Acuticoccus kalidii]MCF3934867.1 cupin domain-containing protein [Acuticoccus kalidii]
MGTIFRQGETPPAWCGLRGFRIVDLPSGGDVAVEIAAPRGRVLVTSGTVQLRSADRSQVLKEAQFFDLAPSKCVLSAPGPAAQAVVLEGDWGEEMGGCGIFRVAEEANPSDHGDPVAYPKKTRVDAHYHDCDEYWILLEGRGRVVVGPTSAEMRPGDCLAIGMGHHHDMPEAPEAVKAVFFETTLEGRKRVGHLWTHTHGTAIPQEERV